jgi:hypothetical protein
MSNFWLEKDLAEDMVRVFNNYFQGCCNEEWQNVINTFFLMFPEYVPVKYWGESLLSTNRSTEKLEGGIRLSTIWMENWKFRNLS